MKKEEINKNSTNSEELIEQLKQLVPFAFKDGILDAKELEMLVNKSERETSSNYKFNWNKKDYSIINGYRKTTTNTLRPVREKSLNFDKAENIIIEGDNLEVLKILNNSYSNKVDVIYIDPPYNTEKDFIYPDNYADPLGNYLKETGQIDEEGNKTSSKIEKVGRKHTNWLNMMYPRLLHARDLLKDDGVIFISIDDNEQSRLKMICDEIFGEENFVGALSWQCRNPNVALISVDHEYLLIYTKKQNFLIADYIKKNTEIEKWNWSGRKIDKKIDNDEMGEYYLISVPTKTKKKNPYKYKYNLSGVFEWNDNETLDESKWIYGDLFAWSKKTLDEKIKSNEIIFEIKKNKLFAKYKDRDFSNYAAISSVIERSVSSYNQNELKKLNMNEAFEYPKPLTFINYILQTILRYRKNALIIDFFAGSGTTGHAVMDLNKEDDGNRKYIMVQLPEKIKEFENNANKKKNIKTEAYKFCQENNLEFKISELTRERIKRSIEKYDYKDEGFKFFKLDSSNLKQWDENQKNEDLNTIDALTSNIKHGRTSEEFLYEIALKTKKELSTKFIEVNIGKNTIWRDELGAFLFSFHPDKNYDNLGNELVAYIEEEKLKDEEGNGVLEKIVLSDNAFKSNSDKLNTLFRVENKYKEIKVEIF